MGRLWRSETSAGDCSGADAGAAGRTRERNMLDVPRSGGRLAANGPLGLLDDGGRLSLIVAIGISR